MKNIESNIDDRVLFRIDELIKIFMGNKYIKCIFLNKNTNEVNGTSVYINVILDFNLMFSDKKAEFSKCCDNQIIDILNEILKTSYRRKDSLFGNDRVIVNYYKESSIGKYLSFLLTGKIIYDKYGEFRDLFDSKHYGLDSFDNPVRSREQYYEELVSSFEESQVFKK